MNNQPAIANGPQDNKGFKQRARGFLGAYWRTAWLPGIGPRLKTLGARFGHFAYLLAMIYGAVRLIKPEHPVLNPANIGQFGFRDVISAAAENVIISKQTIDQVLIFGAVLFGLIAVVVQLFLIVAWAGMDFYMSTAQAQDLGSLFTTPDPKSDLAFIFLDHVFGVDMFGQGNAQPNAFQSALHAMLAMFSMAMLVIAVFILIYFIFVVVGEAAMTGTPFGKRFNGFYAPIRLVLAFGLLIPLANGLNTAQYATLYVAKMGSGMATQAWGVFATAFLEPQPILAEPNVPVLDELVTDLFVSEMCMYAYNHAGQPSDGSGGAKTRGRPIKRVASLWLPASMENLAENSGFKVNGATAKASNYVSNQTSGAVAPYIQVFKEIKAGYELPMLGAILPASDSEQKITLYYTRAKNIKNAYGYTLCGAFNMTLSPKAEGSDASKSYGNILSMFGISQPNINAGEIAESDMIRSIQDKYLSEMGVIIDTIANSKGADGRKYLQAIADASSVSDNFDVNIEHSFAPKEWIAESKVRFTNDVMTLQEYLNDAKQKEMPIDEMIKGGWVTAPVWFNSIARINGRFIDIMNNARPGQVVTAKIMDHLFIDEDEKKERSARKKKTKFDKDQARVMETGIRWYENATEIDVAGNKKGGSRSIIVGMISQLFMGGVHKINQSPSSNPMADLTAIGGNLINKSIVVMGIIVGINTFFGDAAGLDGLTGILSLLVAAGIGAGFILAYLLPLTPFMYFLFAVSGWVSEIFEAIIAMPLWALAHLRIDGDGLMGGAATGYQLLFGIFTRPIFIVFGLMGSYLIFNGSMGLLHATFTDMVASIEGTSPGFIDKFFYMVVYVIIAYNLAMTSFKLIDAVPNQILRWMGISTQGFNDGRENPLSNLNQAAGVAGGYLGQQGASAISQVPQGFRKAATAASQKRDQAESAKVAGERHQDLVNALGRGGGSPTPPPPPPPPPSGGTGGGSTPPSGGTGGSTP